MDANTCQRTVEDASSINTSIKISGIGKTYNKHCQSAELNSTNSNPQHSKFLKNRNERYIIIERKCIVWISIRT